MRLTPARVALILFLIVACPLASIVSYAALTGTAIGGVRVPFGRSAAATATPGAVTPAAGGTRTATALATATNLPSAAGSPTATKNLGVVPATAGTPPPTAAASG